MFKNTHTLYIEPSVNLICDYLFVAMLAYLFFKLYSCIFGIRSSVFPDKMDQHLVALINRDHLNSRSISNDNIFQNR